MGRVSALSALDGPCLRALDRPESRQNRIPNRARTRPAGSTPMGRVSGISDLDGPCLRDLDRPESLICVGPEPGQNQLKSIKIN